MTYDGLLEGEVQVFRRVLVYQFSKQSSMVWSLHASEEVPDSKPTTYADLYVCTRRTTDECRVLDK